MNTLSNDQLVEKIKELRGEEKKVLALLLRYLHELDQRKLYRELGYPSLFAFCTEALGYSEGAAYRRIAAARAITVCPELVGQVESGSLSLCNAAELSKVVTEQNKAELLAIGSGKSHRELKGALVPYQKEIAAPRRTETVRVRKVARAAVPFLVEQASTASKSYSITLELDEGEMALLEEAQRVLSARRLKDTVLKAAKQVVAREKRLTALRDRRSEKSLVTSKVASSPAKCQTATPSRYIPADVRHVVNKRDGNRCSYVAPDGTRCCETRNLELDHIEPWSLGGKNTIQNLRQVCRAHNQLYAERVFGREFLLLKSDPCVTSSIKPLAAEGPYALKLTSELTGNSYPFIS